MNPVSTETVYQTVPKRRNVPAAIPYYAMEPALIPKQARISAEPMRTVPYRLAVMMMKTASMVYVRQKHLQR